MALDMVRLDQFMGKFVSDLGATFHAGMVVIGESLGLYKALAEAPSPPSSWPAKPAPMRGMCVNGPAPRRPGAT